MWWRAATAGLVLGALAFTADRCEGALAVLMLLVSSSALAWGAAALVAGFAAADRRAAAGAAVTVLVVATLVYYGVILADGDRWRGGVLEDGSSAASLGLRSVLRAAAFWLVASLAGGTVLGLLGQAVRRGRPTVAAAAAGAACALLAGQAAVRLAQAGGVAPDHLAQAAPWLVEAAAEAGLAVAVTVILLRRSRRPWRWGRYAAAAGGLLAVALAGWTLVEAVRLTGF